MMEWDKSGESTAEPGDAIEGKTRHSAGPSTSASEQEWVTETRFGTWFINTGVWVKYVLARSIADLVRLAAHRLPERPTVLDVGCGRGKAIPLLKDALRAEALIGVDVDEAEIERARRELRASYPLRFDSCAASDLRLPDGSVDVVFCHQCLHHFIDQRAALREMFRVLRPGGALLLSESCKSFIHTRRIRYLFRHPMEVQKTAEQYLSELERAGFAFAQESSEISFVWWSRRDMGLFERIGFPPRAPLDTLLNVAAIRP